MFVYTNSLSVIVHKPVSCIKRGVFIGMAWSGIVIVPEPGGWRLGFFAYGAAL